MKRGNVSFTVWIERIGAKPLGHGGSRDGPEASRKEFIEEEIHLAVTPR